MKDPKTPSFDTPKDLIILPLINSIEKRTFLLETIFVMKQIYLIINCNKEKSEFREIGLFLQISFLIKPAREKASYFF